VVTLDRISSAYDTAPVLIEDQPRFLNLVCAGHTTLDPLTLLQATQRIERELGRVAGPRYGPRVIDIDLLLYGECVLVGPELTLPHPRLAERAFVLLPLAEIAPDLRHPMLGRRMAELASALSPADVRLLGPLSPASG
jgi:2-amino-4-hydroxy-6-hydroxymethyldihydropteridine diphosphokinase